MKKKISYYALYCGDKFIDVGKLTDLAVKYHTTVQSLRFKATPTYAARTKYDSTIRVYRLKGKD